MIALVFPRSFLVKLSTKTVRISDDQRIRGLKGNVSSHEMPADDIDDLVDPKILRSPHPPRILSSLLSIAWVGKGNIPKTHGLFDVRRDKIAAALTTLKNINPFYAHIEISAERLNALGSPGTSHQPKSIQIRRINDAAAAATEGAGYGVDDDSLDKLHTTRILPCLFKKKNWERMIQ